MMFTSTQSFPVSQTQFSARKNPGPNRVPQNVRNAHQALMDTFMKSPQKITNVWHPQQLDAKWARKHKLQPGWVIKMIVTIGTKDKNYQLINQLVSEGKMRHVKTMIDRRHNGRKSKYDQHWDLYQFQGARLLIQLANR